MKSCLPIKRLSYQLTKENTNLITNDQNLYFTINGPMRTLVSDDHDVLAFLTHSLVPPGQKVESRIDETEKAKFDKEFDQYYEQLEKQKKE